MIKKRQKRHIKSEKCITPMDFAENSKVYYGGFLRNGLHKRYRYISKSRWHLLATVYWLRDEDGIE